MGLLEKLAVRCEIVSGPDRVLDGEICLALGLANGNVRVDERTGWVVGGDTPLPVKPLEYTSSSDAAMSPIPHGRHTEIAMQDRHSGSWKWGLRGGFGVRSEARAPSAARAITAASLRARHALALSKGSDA